MKPKPIVGFPLAKEFNETVAMDLKHWSGNTWLLHIIDHLTRFSASCVINSKRKEVIVQKIFIIWIAIFGQPLSFLVDNGGEFANDEFVTFCENMNIHIKTTAAESPWSNGLVERHNAVLGLTVEKTMLDSNCDLETAVSWAVSAKNSLRNVNGHSPNQLVFGRNPNFPNVLDNKLPAMECSTSSEIVANNLNAMQTARKEYLKSEASEKLNRALKHQVRTYGDVVYQIGELVYFRRKDDDKWKGPAKVVGIDGKQLLLKQGSGSIRVHSCKVKHVNQYERSEIEERSEADESKKNISSTVESDDDLVVEGNNTQLDKEPVRDSERNHVEIVEQSDTEASNIDNDYSNEYDETNRNIVQENTYTYCEPKVHQYVQYKLKDDEWKGAEVISRGGKVGGKFESWYNIRDTQDASVMAIDWRAVENWKPMSDESEVFMSTNEIGV